MKKFLLSLLILSSYNMSVLASDNESDNEDVYAKFEANKRIVTENFRDHHKRYLNLMKDNINGVDIINDARNFIGEIKKNHELSRVYNIKAANIYSVIISKLRRIINQ